MNLLPPFFLADDRLVRNGSLRQWIGAEDWLQHGSRTEAAGEAVDEQGVVAAGFTLRVGEEFCLAIFERRCELARETDTANLLRQLRLFKLHPQQLFQMVFLSGGAEQADGKLQWPATVSV